MIGLPEESTLCLMCLSYLIMCTRTCACTCTCACISTCMPYTIHSDLLSPSSSFPHLPPLSSPSSSYYPPSYSDYRGSGSTRGSGERTFSKHSAFSDSSSEPRPSQKVSSFGSMQGGGGGGGGGGGRRGNGESAGGGSTWGTRSSK